MRGIWVGVAVGVSLAWIGPAPGAVVIDINIDGNIKSIGELNAIIDANNAGRIIATFTLYADYAYLDHCYDFQWVNVEYRYENPIGTNQATDPVLGTLPAIDPQPPPTDPNEDNEPFYYNDGEWLPPGQLFGGFVIHDEGNFSRFIDRPSDGTKNSIIFFTTYLVVDISSHEPNRFVLAGAIDWNYRNNGNSALGVSTITRISGVTDGSDVTLVNTAIGNAGPDGFGDWRALPQTHSIPDCPEPATLLIILAGSLVGGWGLRRRREQTFEGRVAA